MTEEMKKQLLEFHKNANRGSLHILDEARLFAFITVAADSGQNVDKINNEVFEFLTTHEDTPWGDDIARNLVKQIGFGIDLLRYVNQQ